jgi:hypothetical protein
LTSSLFHVPSCATIAIPKKSAKEVPYCQLGDVGIDDFGDFYGQLPFTPSNSRHSQETPTRQPHSMGFPKRSDTGLILEDF